MGGPLVAAGVNPLAPFYINPLAPFYINLLVPFYINAQPPWSGLDFLLLLDQAKRRNPKITADKLKKFAFYEKPLYLCLWSYVRQLSAGLLFFVNTYFSSCAKEEVAPDASTETVAAKKKGEGSLEKNVELDCSCEIQVVSIDNIPDGVQWFFRDITDLDYFPLCSFAGVGNFYYTSMGMDPLPTPFLPLAPPDPGCHHFRIIIPQWQDLSDIVTFHTIMRCTGELNGNPLETEVAYDFVFQEGVQQGEYEGIRLFWRKASCFVIPDGEDCLDQTPPGGSSF